MAIDDFAKSAKTKPVTILISKEKIMKLEFFVELFNKTPI